ncbi:MAG: toll/interleukin-1 receptor domain-containing protein [Gammaproteobacteria bacterium]
MQHNIDAAPQLFVFWCSHAMSSVQVEREYLYALRQKKRVVPVLLDDAPLPPQLAGVHGIDLRRVMRHGEGESHMPGAVPDDYNAFDETAAGEDFERIVEKVRIASLFTVYLAGP